LRRGAAIPNFIWSAATPVAALRPGHLLISLGRLTPQKGYDLLLEAFARIAPRDWHLEIHGEGPLRFKTQPRVTFPGFTTDPAATLARADLYVQPSRAEGFPNALCEAMACGLPVIATDCAPGVRAIVRDGIDGLLVRPNSVTALAAALDRLMNDRDERERFGARAKEIVTRFAVDRVMQQWESLLGA
jgi:glycosyltransferase involved in cell wall biosynthesis